jgi:limonene-1,2-epoxide hydrolase
MLAHHGTLSCKAWVHIMKKPTGVVMNKNSSAKWSSVAAGMVLLAGAWAGAQAADKADKTERVQTAGNNQYERVAIQVVRDWTAAFAARDAAKVKSYMADDAEFRLDPTEHKLSRGHEALQKTLDMILPAIGGIKTLRIYAIGGPNEVLVISDRIDDFNMGGKKLTVPVGGFFRVNPNTRKIEEWLDAPLIHVDLPAPPPGAAPGGPGAPAPK